MLIAAGKIVAGAAHALGGLSWAVPVTWTSIPVETAALALLATVSYTHLTLPTNREV